MVTTIYHQSMFVQEPAVFAKTRGMTSGTVYQSPSMALFHWRRIMYEYMKDLQRMLPLNDEPYVFTELPALKEVKGLVIHQSFLINSSFFNAQKSENLAL
jgi:hypothetical protein